MRIGCHLSIAKGLDKSVELARQVNANTFQFFTRNPRGGAARHISEQEISLWKKLRQGENIHPIVGHLPYTVNAASPKPKANEFAKACIREDLQRMDAIGTEYLVFHPGSYVTGSVEEGIRRIVAVLEESFLPFVGNSVLCLETMSGRGTEVGGNVWELGEIVERVGKPKNLGICLDTCHLFAAGYDFRILEEVNRLVDDLEDQIGMERVLVAHINDSKADTGTRKDRHELIGKGYLGTQGIANFINHPALKDMPLILETPVDEYDDYAVEIKKLKELRRDCK